jgi:putative ABC transport system permease protein
MNELIIGNLIHRPLRSVISAFAVAIEVVMILSITAVMLGSAQGFRDQTSGIGMDMVVRPGAAGNLLSGNAASASVKVATVLEALPHVKVAAPFNVKFSMGASLENIFAIDYPSFNALRPFVFVSGGPFTGPDSVIIDDFQAKSGPHYKVGDKLNILNHDYTISGIFEHGKGSRKFIPLDTMDKLDGTPGKASGFYLRTDDADTPEAKAAIQEQVRQEILSTDGMQQYNVQTLEEFLAGLTPDRLPGFNIALNIVIGIAVVIGFLVIFQSMYTAVMERTREIGILKSMGAGKFSIVSVILRETGLLAIVGIILGVVCSYILSVLVHVKFPKQAFLVTPHWVFLSVCIAMGGAFFGALYPAFKAARKDPIDALSYE